MTTVEDAPAIDIAVRSDDIVTVLDLVYDVIEDISCAEHEALGRLARAAGMTPPEVPE